MIIQAVLVGTFGTIATLTQHGHWAKEAADIEPIVGPLCRLIQQVPTKVLKRVEKKINWVMLAGGCIAVIGPDLAFEVKLRHVEHQHTQVPPPGGHRTAPPGPTPGQGYASNGPVDAAARDTLPPREIAVSLE